MLLDVMPLLIESVILEVAGMSNERGTPQRANYDVA